MNYFLQGTSFRNQLKKPLMLSLLVGACVDDINFFVVDAPIKGSACVCVCVWGAGGEL